MAAVTSENPTGHDCRPNHNCWQGGCRTQHCCDRMGCPPPTCMCRKCDSETDPTDHYATLCVDCDSVYGCSEDTPRCGGDVADPHDPKHWWNR